MGESSHEVRDVFIAATELDTPEERARYLDEVCKAYQELADLGGNLGRSGRFIRSRQQIGNFFGANRRGISPGQVKGHARPRAKRLQTIPKPPIP